MEQPGSTGLEFEKPVIELQARIERLKKDGTAAAGDIARLAERLTDLERKVYRGLNAWEQVQLARHPRRPTTVDYIRYCCEEFEEMHGDRLYGDDPAVVGGIAMMGERRIAIVGHEKGRSTRERVSRNFGMASPEGFRKALRLMKTAARFRLPVLSIVDTPGAYPGVGAEERGQPRAIADNLKELFDLDTPVIVVIIGEGGSGGALALAIGDAVLMLEHAIYSVISPEGCAAILWDSKAKAPDAAEALRLTADDCLRLRVIDRIIEEPHGAAHRDPQGTALRVRAEVLAELDRIERAQPDLLLERRREKYRSMGICDGG
ncbi:MAG: acetyl-CoA carboxylase carboxyltransferase subunit alpha [Candidatus Krumholzibacteria bacterium]|nr:acetyl-CoA carboxylase carboxyltransferase subunit alpha [Candidatus Krumholzibacteria bacterium]